MALQANSYGDPAEVGKLTPRWATASGNTFDATTTPLLTTVESWCDQISAMLNTSLAEQGFTIPVSDADAVLLLDYFVNDEVAAITEGTHGSGRFGPTAGKKGGNKSRFGMIGEDVAAFIEANALGFERLGAERSQNITASMGYRDTDKSGDETHPIFQREGFGETYVDDDAS